MLKRLGPLAVTALLAACGYVSEYEAQVYDWEPLYCYKSLGAVQCYNEPKHSDARRLVNYFGPHPSRYDEPEVPELSEPTAPEDIDYWVKDPEPVPTPALSRVEARRYDAGHAVSKPATAEALGTPSAAPTAAGRAEEMSFFERLRRSMFGKPELANRPLAAAPKTGTL